MKRFAILFIAGIISYGLPLQAQLKSQEMLSENFVGKIEEKISGIASADLNNDGKRDIILCHEDHNLVQILLNVSKSTTEIKFAEPYKFHLNSGSAQKILIADLNRDKLPEIILINSNDQEIYVLRNISSITNLNFVQEQTLYCPATPTAITNCDLNFDAAQDLIVSCGNTIVVFHQEINSKSILFNHENYYSVLTPLFDLKCADLDGDGNTDIIAGGSNGITILKNISGSDNKYADFDEPKYFYAQRAVISLDIGDLDGDFMPDIVTANWPDSDITVFRNNSMQGEIVFDATELIPASSPRNVALADFNGDGKFDIVSSSFSNVVQTTEIFRNISSDATISFSSAENFIAIQSELIIGDFNKDGIDDIAGICVTKQNVVLLIGENNSKPQLKSSLEIYCGEDALVWMDWYVPLDYHTNEFRIEKSINGNDFLEIATVSNGEIKSDGKYFTYCDTNISGEIAWYRYSSTNSEGITSVSAIQMSLPCNSVITEFVCAYPNPVDKMISFQFSLSEQLQMRYSIMDLNMITKLEKIEAVTPGTRTYTLDISQLTKGSYIFAVQFGNLPAKVCRFEKL